MRVRQSLQLHDQPGYQAGSRNLAATTAGLEPNSLLTFRHLLIVVHQRFACADLPGFTWHYEAKGGFPRETSFRSMSLAQISDRLPPPFALFLSLSLVISMFIFIFIFYFILLHVFDLNKFYTLLILIYKTVSALERTCPKAQ